MSETVKVGDRWCDARTEVRVMAVAEGWAMVRRRGCMPFAVFIRDMLALDEWQPVSRKPRPTPEAK
jgi:hypothetical protein